MRMLSYNLINTRERKIRFHFRLVMRPDIGEFNFDGECELESPQQNKINFVIKTIPKPLRIFIDNFILKYSYYHAEKFAKQENFPFPPAQELLKIVVCNLLKQDSELKRYATRTLQRKKG